MLNVQAPSLSGKGDEEMDTSDGAVMFNMGGGQTGYPAGYTQDQVEGKFSVGIEPKITHHEMHFYHGISRHECPAEPDSLTTRTRGYVSRDAWRRYGNSNNPIWRKSTDCRAASGWAVSNAEARRREFDQLPGTMLNPHLDRSGPKLMTFPL